MDDSFAPIPSIPPSRSWSPSLSIALSHSLLEPLVECPSCSCFITLLLDGYFSSFLTRIGDNNGTNAMKTLS